MSSLHGLVATVPAVEVLSSLAVSSPVVLVVVERGVAGTGVAGFASTGAVSPRHWFPSLATVSEADAPVLGRMLAVAHRLASENGSPDGCREPRNGRRAQRRHAVEVGQIGQEDLHHQQPGLVAAGAFEQAVDHGQHLRGLAADVLRGVVGHLAGQPGNAIAHHGFGQTGAAAHPAAISVAGQPGMRPSSSE